MGCVASSPTHEDTRHAHKDPHEVGSDDSSPELMASDSGRGGGRHVDKMVAESSRKALRSILAGRMMRDYLIDASGKRVKIDALRGAPVGILFTAQTIPQGRSFKRLLLEVSKQLKAAGRPFEVVLVSNDETEELWKAAVVDTPWVTLPFKDLATVDAIGTRFEIGELPTFILLDREGNFVTKEGIEVINKLGASAWPFSADSIKAAKVATAGHARPAERPAKRPAERPEEAPQLEAAAT